jgi:hypothetical protein
MNRYFLALTLTLLAAWPAAPRAPYGSDTATVDCGIGWLAVVDGKVRVFPTNHVPERWEWRLDRGLQVKGGKWDGWFLSVDPSGKSHRVVLSRDWNPGAVWWFRVKVRDDTDEWGPIKVGAGPYKGWYLDIDDTVEHLSDGKGDAPRCHRLIITDAPRRIRKFDVRSNVLLQDGK